MANRDALRDLQSRLASRLQAARTEGVQASWLAVECAGAKYLLPLAQSGEIFPFTNPQTVPYTQAWFLGVANLRGGLYGVIDLGSFITERAPAAQTDAIRAECRLIALNAMLEVNCALLIDRLAGLRGMDAFSSSNEPPAGSPDFFGNGYLDAGGMQWQELNLQALAQHSQFLSISA